MVTITIRLVGEVRFGLVEISRFMGGIDGVFDGAGYRWGISLNTVPLASAWEIEKEGHGNQDSAGGNVFTGIFDGKRSISHTRGRVDGVGL